MEESDLGSMRLDERQEPARARSLPHLEPVPRNEAVGTRGSVLTP